MWFIKLLPGATVLLGHEDGRHDKPAVVQVYQGAVQELTVQALGNVDIQASEVRAGGSLSLVLHDVLLAWTSQLQAQNVGIGLTVPPLVAANTTITKGA